LLILLAPHFVLLANQRQAGGGRATKKRGRAAENASPGGVLPFSFFCFLFVVIFNVIVFA
jgi:hypothetical protein